jgi:hypothetical protein
MIHYSLPRKLLKRTVVTDSTRPSRSSPKYTESPNLGCGMRTANLLFLQTMNIWCLPSIRNTPAIKHARQGAINGNYASSINKVVSLCPSSSQP